jgi:hypothetical protein
MYATVRRYEGIDELRSEEITREGGATLLRALRKLPGFSGCYVFDDGEGVSTSIALSKTRKRP